MFLYSFDFFDTLKRILIEFFYYFWLKWTLFVQQRQLLFLFVPYFLEIVILFFFYCIPTYILGISWITWFDILIFHPCAAYSGLKWGIIVFVIIFLIKFINLFLHNGGFLNVIFRLGDMQDHLNRMEWF